MTLQTQCFIDFSDILSFRFECKGCGARISIQFQGEIRTGSLRSCPYCNEAWTQLPDGSNVESRIKAFTDGVKQLQELVKRLESTLGKSGFSVSLEIRPLVSERSELEQ